MNKHRSLPVAILCAFTGIFSMPVSTVHAAGQLGGDAVPGVCVLSRESVFAKSKVGVAASLRLGQLAGQSRGGLDSQRKLLVEDIKSFQEKESSLNDAKRKQQSSALRQRLETLQAQTGKLNQRIQVTRTKVMQRISDQTEPLVVASYRSHHCGLLLNRGAILGGNMANDLTGEVVDALDRKISTIDFSLELLPESDGK